MMEKTQQIGRHKRVALFYRLATPTALHFAKTLNEWFHSRDYEVYTGPGQKIIPGTKEIRSLNKLDLVIALGGDGTYLRAARHLKGKIIPILGINLGSLGFLTPIKVEETFQTIENLINQKVILIPRSMIQILLMNGNKKLIEASALNDVVIERGSRSQLINIRMSCKNHLISEVKADGLILATPTGSTAYNLSAGGPIIHPEVRGFVVTAISPHSLSHRPFLVPDHQTLNFELLGSNKKANLIADGQKLADFTSKDQLILKRSKNFHWMLQDHQHNYFQLLREKLKFGERT